MSALVSTSLPAAYPGLAAQQPAQPASARDDGPGSGHDFVHGLLEILNPLQHIPIISTIYRSITGDTIGPVERIAGDTLYGGPLGLASSVANVAFQKITGKDFGDTVMGWLHIDLHGTGDNKVEYAKSDTAAPAAATGAATAAVARVATAAPTPLSPPQSRSVSTPKAVSTGSLSLASFSPGNQDVDPADIAAQLFGPAKAASAPSNTTKSAATSSSQSDSTNRAAALDASLALVAPESGNSGSEDKDTAALIASMNKAGVSPDLGMRALYAYRKTMAMPVSAAGNIATTH